MGGGRRGKSLTTNLHCLSVTKHLPNQNASQDVDYGEGQGRLLSLPNELLTALESIANQNYYSRQKSEHELQWPI